MTFPQRVLVVDDDPGALDALGELLRDEGFEVKTATRAEQALALTATFQPHLALIDIEMPVTTGIDLLRELRKTRAAITAVMMTAHGSETVRQQAKHLGAVEVLDKPLDVTVVVAAIRGALASGSGARGPTALV